MILFNKSGNGKRLRRNADDDPGEPHPANEGAGCEDKARPGRSRQPTDGEGKHNEEASA